MHNNVLMFPLKDLVIGPCFIT